MPISFLDFCDELGVQLEDGQRVLAAIAFDGVQPRDMGGKWRALARELFGECVLETTPDQRSRALLLIGRRGGKSFLAALRMLHLSQVVDFARLQPGKSAVGLVIAPALDKASDTFAFLVGQVLANARLRAMLVAPQIANLNPKSRYFRLQRPDGKTAEFRVGAANRGGIVARGNDIFACVLEEAAFFFDDGHVVNDEEIYAAALPGMMPGAQLLLVTSPNARTGLVWDLFDANFGHPDTCLVARAPTETLRSEPTILAQVDAERRRASADGDMADFEREFCARFITATATTFFDEETLERMIDDELAQGAPAKPGETMLFGADFGFRRNSSTLAGGARAGRVTRVVTLLELRPEPGSPLIPSETCATFATEVKRYVPKDGSVMSDGHYRESIAEHMRAHGVLLRDAPMAVDEPFVHTRTLGREGRFRIPRHPRLLKQMRAVKQQPRSGGGISILLPKPTATDGAHGDVVSALVLVGWQAWGARVPEPLKPETEIQRAERVQREWEERQERERGWLDRRKNRIFAR